MRNFCFQYLNKAVLSTCLIFTLIFSLYALSVTEAQARTSPYLRGETTAPDCSPGDVNCTVSTSTPYYDPSTNTIYVTNTVVGNATTTNLWVGALTGVLRAFNGHVFAGLVDLVNDVIGVLPVVHGGTGTSTTPIAGQLLIGNSSGGYDLVSTSTLGFLSGGGDVIFQNATTTNLVVTDNLSLDLLDGCIEVAGGVLTSTGSNCGIGGGGVSSLNGLTNSSQSFATSSAGGLTFNVASAGGIHTFTAGLASGYSIPTVASSTSWDNIASVVVASSTNWDTAYGWGNHASRGYLTDISTTTVRNFFSAGSGLSYNPATGQFSNSGVTSIGGLTGAVATSSLGLPTFSDLHNPVTLAGQNYLSISGQQITANAINLSGTHATGTLASARLSGVYSGITGLGTIGSGTWQGSVIAPIYGGTGLNSYTTGDILYANSATSLARRAIGNSGNVLWVSASGLPEWTATSSLGIDFSDMQGIASTSQIPLNLQISSGTIEATPIGITTPAVGLFTGITAGNSTTTHSVTDILKVNATATTPILDVTTALRLGTGTGLLRSTSGLITSVASGGVNLASDVSGVLAPSQGGTGLVNIQAGAILFGNGSGGFATTSGGLGGQVLSFANGLPTWVATTTFSGPLVYANGNVNIGNGTIGNNLLSNTSINVSAGTGLLGGGSTALGGTATLSLNTANANNWTGLQSFLSASTSLLTVTGTSTFGGSSFNAAGKLTLANIGIGGVITTDITGALVSSSTPTLSSILISSTTATSTIAGGLAIGGNKLVVDRVTGNVGIGASLSVTGKVASALGFSGACHTDNLNIIDGLIAALGVLNALGCNQDLAEAYGTFERTYPGEIVALPLSGQQVFDENGVALVGRARGVEGETIIGVVSLNPGLVFNNGTTHLAGANDELITDRSTVVALAGRVPLRVSAENGPIKAGDKLTQSKTSPGVAMKATDPGMVVGTALQSYSGDGESMILMFVDLHWYPGENDGPFDAFTNAVNWALEKLGIVITNGIAMLRELTAERVNTSELCIDGVCIGKQQLQDILRKSEVRPVVPEIPDEEISTEEDGEIEVIDDEEFGGTQNDSGTFIEEAEELVNPINLEDENSTVSHT